MPEKIDPPARRDEPVSSSRKWMLPVALCGVLLLAYAGVYMYFTCTGMELVGRYLGLGVAAYFLGLTVLRSLKAAAQCRHHRNFDTLAAALRPQRAAWLTMTVLIAVFAVTVPVFTYLMKHNSAGLPQFLELYRAHSSAKPSHPARP